MEAEGSSGSSTHRRERLDLVDASWVLRLCIRRMRFKPWQMAATAFGGYYLLPLALSAASGALLTESVVAQQLAPLGLGEWATWVARAHGVSQPYGTDIVHLAMASVAMLLGTLVMVHALTGFSAVFDSLQPQLLAPTETVAGEVSRAARLLRNRIVRVALLVTSTVLANFMLGRTTDSQYTGWWGHTSHGPAGIAFAVFVWAMVFFGGLYLYCLAVGLNALSRLFRYPVELRPFHPDECNGFGAFGNYLILLLVLAVLIATALWITFFGGYLGVERFAVTWIGGLAGMLSIPAILLIPLVRLTLQIGAARDARLSRVESLLNRQLMAVEERLESPSDHPASTKDIEHLVSMRRALRDLYPTNIFPFRPRIAGTLSVGYAVQVGIFLYRALESFR